MYINASKKDVEMDHPFSEFGLRLAVSPVERPRNEYYVLAHGLRNLDFCCIYPNWYTTEFSSSILSQCQL